VCRWFLNGAKRIWDLQRGSTYPLSMVRNHIKANAPSRMLMSPSLVENHFEKIFWPPIAYMRLSVFFSQPIKNKNRHQSCPAKRVQFSCLRAWLAWFRLIAFFACVVSLFIVSGGSLPPITIVCCD